MIDTSHSALVGGAGIWTPNSTLVGSFSKSLTQLIKSLFSDGTQGIYLNAQDALSVSDLSSIKDLSGNNNHALQPDSMKRASLITDPSGYKSLKFDGIDDGYATASIDFSNTDEVTVIAAIRKLSDSGVGTVCELSQTSVSNDGTFCLGAPLGIGFNGVGFRSRGTILVNNLTTTPVSPASSVVTDYGKISNDTNIIRINGVLASTVSSDQGLGNYGNYPLYIGRRGGTTNPFNGHFYALLIIGRLLTDKETTLVEKEFAKYIGVVL